VALRAALEDAVWESRENEWWRDCGLRIQLPFITKPGTAQAPERCPIKRQSGGDTMKKALIASAAAGALALAAIATPQPAEARHGGAVAAGAIGGFAAGAIVGSALAPRPAYGYYGPAYGYYGPVYGPPAYAAVPGCYWSRKRVVTASGAVRVTRVRVCN
jgi:hypothetical protein